MALAGCGFSVALSQNLVRPAPHLHIGRSSFGRSCAPLHMKPLHHSAGESTTPALVKGRMTTSKLSGSDGPLVWIDCEMTGLDAGRDRLLEVACIITDGQLNAVDDGVNFTILTAADVLKSMDPWCVSVQCKRSRPSWQLFDLPEVCLCKPPEIVAHRQAVPQIRQHGGSGLTALCQDSQRSLPLKEVRKRLLNYVTTRIEKKGTAVLAGNSVHADKAFLLKETPELLEFLHYRIVDVSSVKELVRRWYGAEHVWQKGRGAHRALDDIRDSINELRYYRENYFVQHK